MQLSGQTFKSAFIFVPFLVFSFCPFQNLIAKDPVFQVRAYPEQILCDSKLQREPEPIINEYKAL